MMSDIDLGQAARPAVPQIVGWLLITRGIRLGSWAGKAR
jgi:hypothetical protein